MTITMSRAADEESDYYTGGSCHVFAVALNRLTGWPMHVVLDLAEQYWTDPSDEDNFIPSVAHVLCVDPTGHLWDVKGVRPASSIRREMMNDMDVVDYDSDLCRNEDALSLYVGCWGEDGEAEIDRPLEVYDEDDLAVAHIVMREALGELLKQAGYDVVPSALAARL